MGRNIAVILAGLGKIRGNILVIQAMPILTSLDMVVDTHNQ
jgi:hypothetical protein